MTPSPLRARRLVTRLLWGSAAALVLFFLSYSYFFGPTDKFATAGDFVVTPEQDLGDVATALEAQGYVRNRFVFEAAYRSVANKDGVRAGGYRISKAMDAWSIAKTFGRQPYLAWITIKPGMRKEQIATMLARELSWSEEEKEEWLRVATNPSPSFTEGVYYPDTYLIPSGQSPRQVADRIRSRFQEVFAPYANEAASQGKDWTDVLNLASLVEREAARNDKALVAAILWNRLEIGMPLQVDATLQYIKGNEETGWWPVPRSEDKYLVSPFNTYKHEGLPPHPIANPSLDSIRAVLDPDSTSCLFYLHDNNGQIHCSQTYAQHRAFVDQYLR